MGCGVSRDSCGTCFKPNRTIQEPFLNNNNNLPQHATPMKSKPQPFKDNSIPCTPSGADKSLYKHLCPICYCYCKVMYVSGNCCGHSICPECVLQHVQGFATFFFF